MEEATTTTPPFHRFHLTEKLRLPQAPTHVDPEPWTRFWESLKPLITKVQRKDDQAQMILLIVSSVVLVACIALAMMQSKNHEISISLVILAVAIVALVLIQIYRMITSFVKLYHCAELQGLCQEWENQFLTLALECRLMVGILPARSEGYYLYVVPHAINSWADTGVAVAPTSHEDMDYQRERGYLRVEIVRERLCGGCGGTPSKTPTMYSDYVPAGLETIALSDWNDFWSKIEENSHFYANCTRKRWLGSAGFYGTLFIVSVVSDSVVTLPLLLIQILSLITMIKCQHELNRLEREHIEHVQDFVAIFKSQQVSMEYCTVTTRHWLVGSMERRYLYFYPIQQK